MIQSAGLWFGGLGCPCACRQEIWYIRYSSLLHDWASFEENQGSTSWRFQRMAGELVNKTLDPALANFSKSCGRRLLHYRFWSCSRFAKSMCCLHGGSKGVRVDLNYWLSCRRRACLFEWCTFCSSSESKSSRFMCEFSHDNHSHFFVHSLAPANQARPTPTTNARRFFGGHDSRDHSQNRSFTRRENSRVRVTSTRTQHTNMVLNPSMQIKACRSKRQGKARRINNTWRALH